MRFIRSSRKPIEKVSSDSSVLSYDLLSNLTYMAALSTAEVPRDTILQHVMVQPYMTAIYFKQVYLLTKRLGFEYSRSFQLVSTRARAETIKNLLLRFAGAISSGESEHEMLMQESRVEREKFVSEYQRAVQTLQKWIDAYAALMVSLTLIVVVALISTMIYPIGESFVLMMVGTMYVVSFFGSYVIYRSAPYEVKMFKNRRGPKERQRAVFFFKVLTPIGILAALAVMFIGGTLGFGLAMIALGASLMPAGIYAFLDDNKVTKLDQDVSKFLRSMGNVSGALGTTLSAAMAKIDRRSLGTLEPHSNRLHARLSARINPKVCWDRFIDETGSELAHRSTRMFVDGVDLGGKPERVGAIAADYAMDIGLLRAGRQVTAIPFAYLNMALHGAMTGLLIFILEVMRTFQEKLSEPLEQLGDQSSLIQGQVPDLPVFRPSDTGLITVLIFGSIIVLTVSNSLAPKFAAGGHHLMLAFYGSILCVASGVNMVVIPPLASQFLD